jgi:hypothetical protein
MRTPKYSRIKNPFDSLTRKEKRGHSGDAALLAKS